jgi:ATP-dependent exoDNAse (exonuclease V) alpha subunit
VQNTARASRVFRSAGAKGYLPEHPPSQPILPTDAQYELLPGVHANAAQRYAIDRLNEFLLSDERTFTLIGRAGTGKTTIVRAVVEQAKANRLFVGGGAVSHAAKEVLSESIGSTKVYTVAALLAIKLNEATGQFEPDAWARGEGMLPIAHLDLIVIDECSMISHGMMEEILELARPQAQVIFMGDNVQLPPIGDGDSESPTFSVSREEFTVKLTERVRQGEESPIVSLSDVLADNIEGAGALRALTPRLRVSDYDLGSDSGLVFVREERKAVEMLVSDLQADPGNPRGTKAVVFNNERYTKSSQSVLNLNRRIREELHGLGAATQFNPGEIVVAYASWSESRKFAPLVHNALSYVVVRSSKASDRRVRFRWMGQRFDQTYGVVDLTVRDHRGDEVTVPVVAARDLVRYRADLGRVRGALYYRLAEAFADIQYGYAVTSHKAQGATYRNVYVFEDNILGRSNPGSPVVKNKSFYVAVTRAAAKLVVVSEANPVFVAAAPAVVEDEGQAVLERLLASGVLKRASEL